MRAFCHARKLHRFVCYKSQLLIFTWMSMDGQGTKRHRNITRNFNLLSRMHKRSTDQQTDGRQTDLQRHIANVARNLKILL